MVFRCSSRRRNGSSNGGREESRPLECWRQPRGDACEKTGRGLTPHKFMHMTSFEEFKELAQRGTFVPVYKEIVADMLTPVSAFLKVAEHSDYAFLLESVERGEQVGRYSFLGKDPFLILRSRGGKTTIDRMGEVTESEKPFIATVRELVG